MDYYKAFIVVCCFILADFLTGIVSALWTGTYKSRIMREGLIHKATELFIIGLAFAVEVGFPVVGIDVSIPLTLPVICYIVLMEIGSIIENLCKMNPDLKQLADRYFAQYEKKEGE